MEDLRQYFIGITAAALICGIAKMITGKQGALAAATGLLAGVYMILAVASPWAKFRLTDITDYADSISFDSAAAVNSGKSEAMEALREGIKQQAEAYILDKAESLGAELTVEVRVEGSDVPLPCAAIISGSISPYGKSKLVEIIEEDLGIPSEDQIWNGQG